MGHTHPGVNGVYMHPMDGDMDNVPACLDSLLDERLSLVMDNRKLLQIQSAVYILKHFNIKSRRIASHIAKVIRHFYYRPFCN